MGRFALLWVGLVALCHVQGADIHSGSTRAEEAGSATASADTNAKSDPLRIGAAVLSADDLQRRFVVQRYEIQGSPILTNVPASSLSEYTGTNVGLTEIIAAASHLQSDYSERGYPMTSIAFAWQQITNGVVPLNVAQSAIAQIVVSGRRWAPQNNAVPAVSAATNLVKQFTPAKKGPATPEQMARARAALRQDIAAMEARELDTRVHVVSTNAGPRFNVERYLVEGNSVLSPETITQVLTNIDGAFGTNVSFEGVRTAVEQLQQAYRDHGYVTVAVGLPAQKLTNGTVKVQVTEGRLADIKINWIGGHYFSSNNVMRALPSLRTNLIIDAPIFNAELNRANANQDRQIYPVIGPGPEPGTSELTLRVKDRLPLHAKMELDNQSSPGTPDLRLNTSAVYNNLWQLEHSLGVQYSFSPETYKQGPQWNFYDQPLVANYSAFYRMPLGGPQSIATTVANNPGSFGYSEATRQFNLPPSIGRPELTVYGSRATIDTGLNDLSSSVILDVPGVRSIVQNYVQQDLTINEDIGLRFSTPLSASTDFQSDFSGGLDYKIYRTATAATNIFQISEITLDENGQPNPPRISTVASAVPFTENNIKYLPLSLQYNGGWSDPFGTVSFGVGLSANLWYDSRTSIASDTNTTILTGEKSLRQITGSSKSSGHWVVITPSFSDRFQLVTNWTTTVRVNGQWASEPLISSERFGAGGVNSVRGYHEGEVFGDAGWHLSLEQETPPILVGMVHGNTPLTLRGSVYMDYATVYLLDPRGQSPFTDLWGTGFGFAASLGPHWQSQFLFSFPLLSAGTTTAFQPFFNFALSGQF